MDDDRTPPPTPTLAARIVCAVGAVSTGCAPLIAVYGGRYAYGLKFWLIGFGALALVIIGAIVMLLSNVYPFMNWQAEQTERQMYGRVNPPASNPDTPPKSN